MTNPSEVEVTLAPAGAVTPAAGKSSVAEMPLPMSMISGRSQAMGLGITMPTFGKDPKYLSTQRLKPVPKKGVAVLAPTSRLSVVPPTFPLMTWPTGLSRPFAETIPSEAAPPFGLASSAGSVPPSAALEARLIFGATPPLSSAAAVVEEEEEEDAGAEEEDEAGEAGETEEAAAGTAAAGTTAGVAAVAAGAFVVVASTAFCSAAAESLPPTAAALAAVLYSSCSSFENLGTAILLAAIRACSAALPGASAARAAASSDASAGAGAPAA